MPAPILATKLFIPPSRSNVVLRPRLLERLNEGISSGCKLILVSAPAGFGKTTLVSEWIAGLGDPAAWLSLDEGDKDLTRFLTYLISALQAVKADIGAGLLGVLESPQPPVESILIALLNEAAAIPHSFALVLDDYHLVDARPVDDTLAFLIDHMPPQMHLIIATREDPGLSLARLRARGQLTELRAADLRFTSAESGVFFNQAMGLNLSAEETSILENRAEGWAAGLQLAALSMQGRDDIAGFIRSFAGDHRYIADYLVEEVIQRRPEPVRRFLLQTAILDRLNGSLCEAVTGQAESGSRLEDLERGNFFVVALDDQRRWYRYHQLFADVLRMHLKMEQPDQVAGLHRRASEWYEREGQAADAIHHALAAQDYERAARLIELAAPEIRRNRQETTLTELSWLKALPAELLRFRPVLSVAYAYALFGGGELETVEDRLQDAERWLGASAGTLGVAAGMVVVDEKEYRRLPGMIALLRTAQALARGDMPETVKNAQQVLDLAPEDDHLMLGGAASTLGLAAWANGDLETAHRMITDGMTNVRRAGYISPAIGDAITLADIQIAQGRLREARSTYQQALQWATPPGALVLRGAADMYVGLSSLCYEQNDLAAAAQHLLTSQSLGDLAGLPQNPYRWRAAMARIRAAQGDLDGALDLLDQAERVYNGNFSPNVRPLAARKARLWLAQGRLDEALAWVRAQGLSVDDDLSYRREFDHITLVRVLLAVCRRNPADAFMAGVLGLLERLLKAAKTGGRSSSVIEILILQAPAKQMQGDIPAALESLRQALSLAEPEGYVRMFLDEGPNMLRLLREAASRGIMPDYTSKLLSAFDVEPPEGQPAGRALTTPELLPIKNILVEPLSQRELEVLKLIAQGLSNRDIGARLFLALDTVKGHNRKIFDKLQVQSRTEAIARARELGLL
jgi:LuxR family maltose regulon positive regulatory protein